ncbi:molybdopterin-guanine dinucleotide biosynthesis protein B [Paludibacterium yongneupense]|uniref:molybdopterin-guanine dinucleotide biosynthesis protein B n=1 Tax=Paludibacterium yongneupense TaxID=400061 RepID=UPI000423A420|nr:molybdopterin-guanine dinucleotide biosynthesis protein B [Paludibacterium yongneupense]
MSKVSTSHAAVDLPPVLGVCGWSGSGKTSLIERLLPVFAEAGLRVNVVKHSHHAPTLEPAGKDTARFRAAGAHEVMLASPWGVAIMSEARGAQQAPLNALLARLAPADLILVEGFKHEAIPRLEVWRAATGKPLLAATDSGIIAVASDSHPECDVPLVDLDDTIAVASFILQTLGIDHGAISA